METIADPAEAEAVLSLLLDSLTYMPQFISTSCLQKLMFWHHGTKNFGRFFLKHHLLL